MFDQDKDKTKVGEKTLADMLAEFKQRIRPLLPKGTDVKDNHIFEFVDEIKELGRKYILIDPETYENKDAVRQALKKTTPDPKSGRTFKDATGTGYSDAAMQAAWNIATIGENVIKADTWNKLKMAKNMLSGNDESVKTAMNVLDKSYPIVQVIDDKTFELALAYRELLLAIKKDTDVLTLGYSPRLGGNYLKGKTEPACDEMLTRIEARIDDYFVQRFQHIQELMNNEKIKIADEVVQRAEELIKKRDDILLKIEQALPPYTSSEDYIKLQNNKTEMAQQGTVDNLKNAAHDTANTLVRMSKKQEDLARLEQLKKEAEHDKPIQKAIDKAVKDAKKQIESPNVASIMYMQLHFSMDIPNLNSKRIEELSSQIESLPQAIDVSMASKLSDNIEILQNNIKEMQQQFDHIEQTKPKIDKAEQTTRTLLEQLQQEHNNLQNNTLINGQTFDLTRNPFTKIGLENYNQAIEETKAKLAEIEKTQKQIQDNKDDLANTIDAANEKIRLLESKDNIEKLTKLKEEKIAEFEKLSLRVNNTKQAKTIVSEFIEMSKPLQTNIKTLRDEQAERQQQFEVLQAKHDRLQITKNNINKDHVAALDAEQLASDLSITTDTEKADFSNTINTLKQPEDTITWLSKVIIQSPQQTAKNVVAARLTKTIAETASQMATLFKQKAKINSQISEIQGKLSTLTNAKNEALKKLDLEPECTAEKLSELENKATNQRQLLAVDITAIDLDRAKLRSKELTNEIKQIQTELDQLDFSWDFDNNYRVQTDRFWENKSQLTALQQQYKKCVANIDELRNKFQATYKVRSNLGLSWDEKNEIKEFNELNKETKKCSKQLTEANQKLNGQGRRMENHYVVQERKVIQQLAFKEGSEGRKLADENPAFKQYVDKTLTTAFDVYEMTGQSNAILNALEECLEEFKTDDKIMDFLVKLSTNVINTVEKQKAAAANKSSFTTPSLHQGED